MPPIRNMIRLARKIHAAYQHATAKDAFDLQTGWSQLEYRFQLARDEQGSIQKARGRGWHLAANQQQDQFAAVLESLSKSMHELRQKLRQPPESIPSFRDLFDELQNLKSEFDEVLLDKQQFIDVRTEPITLKDVSLGRFAIRWHWPRLAAAINVNCFEVVALNPNSANGNSGVTHPHVRDRSLCVGDAAAPLQNALLQGRLTDAFQIIHCVLRTYNKHSAYATLDDWDGVTCWDCGCTTDEDDRSYCDGCDRDFCSDCMRSCKHCDHERCASCMSRCDVCNESCCAGCQVTSEHSELSICKDCLRTCTSCDAEVASSEFDSDSELCTTCFDAQDANEDDVVDNDQPAPATPT